MDFQDDYNESGIDIPPNCWPLYWTKHWLNTSYTAIDYDSNESYTFNVIDNTHNTSSNNISCFVNIIYPLEPFEIAIGYIGLFLFITGFIGNILMLVVL